MLKGNNLRGDNDSNNNDKDDGSGGGGDSTARRHAISKWRPLITSVLHPVALKTNLRRSIPP